MHILMVPIQVIQKQEKRIRPLRSVAAITTADKEIVVPVADILPVVVLQQIQALIFSVNHETAIHLESDIRTEAKTMQGLRAILTTEIHIETIRAARAKFHEIEHAVAHLRRQSQVEAIAIQAQTEIAAKNGFPFHIMHLRKKLRL